MALEYNRSAHMIDQTHDGLQGCGFTRAVTADKADDLALAHFDADVLQHVAGAIPRVKVADLQHRFSAPAGQDRRASPPRSAEPVMAFPPPATHHDAAPGFGR